MTPSSGPLSHSGAQRSQTVGVGFTSRVRPLPLETGSYVIGVASGIRRLRGLETAAGAGSQPPIAAKWSTSAGAARTCGAIGRSRNRVASRNLTTRRFDPEGSNMPRETPGSSSQVDVDDDPVPLVPDQGEDESDLEGSSSTFDASVGSKDWTVERWV